MSIFNSSLFYYCSLIISLDIRQSHPSTFQIILNVLGTLRFHMNFKIMLPIYAAGVLIGIVLISLEEN